MDVDRLYTIWLNVNASYAITGKTRLVFGVTPQISTDFDTWTSHNIFLGGHVLLAGPLNDRFSYGIGIGCYPQLGDYPFLPLIQFKWEASRNWTLQLEGARLSYINKVSDGLKWGPFVSVVSGTWTIHHDRRVRQFAWISGVAGIGADVGWVTGAACAPGWWRMSVFPSGISALSRPATEAMIWKSTTMTPVFICVRGCYLSFDRPTGLANT